MPTIPRDPYPLYMALAMIFTVVGCAAVLSFRDRKRGKARLALVGDPLFLLGALLAVGGFIGGCWAVAVAIPYTTLTDQTNYPMNTLHLVTAPSVFLGSLISVPLGVVMSIVALRMNRRL
jgi:hypothetical protein